jgi:hypothetical protein
VLSWPRSGAAPFREALRVSLGQTPQTAVPKISLVEISMPTYPAAAGPGTDALEINMHQKREAEQGFNLA